MYPLTYYIPEKPACNAGFLAIGPLKRLNSAGSSVMKKVCSVFPPSYQNKHPPGMDERLAVKCEIAFRNEIMSTEPANPAAHNNTAARG
jgi:hypothetical protein